MAVHVRLTWATKLPMSGPDQGLARRSAALASHATKEGSDTNGMKLAPELLVYQLLTQFLPGFEHQGEALGPPFLDPQLYSMRSDRVDDQRASRRQPPQPSLVIDRRGRAIPPVTAPRRRHPPLTAASKRPSPPQLAATGAVR
jgi:hypothetical protein